MEEISSMEEAEDAGWDIIDRQPGRIRMANIKSKEEYDDSWFCLECSMRLDSAEAECEICYDPYI